MKLDNYKQLAVYRDVQSIKDTEIPGQSELIDEKMYDARLLALLTKYEGLSKENTDILHSFYSVAYENQLLKLSLSNPEPRPATSQTLADVLLLNQDQYRKGKEFYDFITQHQQQNSDKIATIKSLEDNIDFLRAQVRSMPSADAHNMLIKHLDYVQFQNKHLNARLKNANTQTKMIKPLQETISKLQSERDETKKQMSELIQNVSDQTQVADQSKEEAQRMKELHQEASNRLLKQVEDSKRMSEELTSNKKINDLLQQQVQQLTADNEGISALRKRDRSEADKEKNELQESNKRLKTTNTQLNAELKDSQKSIQDYKQFLENEKVHRAKLLSEVDAMKRTKTDHAGVSSKQQRKIDELQAHLKKWEEVSRKQEQVIKDLNQKFVHISVDLETKISRYEKTIQDNTREMNNSHDLAEDMLNRYLNAESSHAYEEKFLQDHIQNLRQINDRQQAMIADRDQAIHELMSTPNENYAAFDLYMPDIDRQTVIPPELLENTIRYENELMKAHNNIMELQSQLLTSEHDRTRAEEKYKEAKHIQRKTIKAQTATFNKESSKLTAQLVQQTEETQSLKKKVKDITQEQLSLKDELREAQMQANILNLTSEWDSLVLKFFEATQKHSMKDLIFDRTLDLDPAIEPISMMLLGLYLNHKFDLTDNDLEVVKTELLAGNPATLKKKLEIPDYVNRIQELSKAVPLKRLDEKTMKSTLNENIMKIAPVAVLSLVWARHAFMEQLAEQVAKAFN